MPRGSRITHHCPKAKDGGKNCRHTTINHVAFCSEHQQLCSKHNIPTIIGRPCKQGQNDDRRNEQRDRDSNRLNVQKIVGDLEKNIQEKAIKARTRQVWNGTKKDKKKNFKDSDDSEDSTDPKERKKPNKSKKYKES
ncbi:hypothetical protein M426DRAFT_8059 [Hypoxylon sp. CI-4A]|nr:hypothetical protein M426DRAFT_8059 [Hypoxylon sp. CI-4A]